MDTTSTGSVLGGLLMATCSTCFCHFESDAPWKKLCLSCWKKKRNAAAGYVAAPVSELILLKMQNIVLEQKLRAVEELARRKSVPPNMIARLIRLAHPDKHANSTAANEATAWLLAQRGAI